MQTELFLTAEEAASMLGVAVPSLYAYVGRKGIRTQSVPGSRARHYWREDIERLSAKGSKERAIVLDSLLVPETKITLLTESGHFYRGVSAAELSREAELEDVAALLWMQDRKAVFHTVRGKAPANFHHARKALAHLSPADQASGLFPLLEAANPRNYDRSALGFARSGAEVLRWFTTLVVNAEEPTDEPVHLVLAQGLQAPPGYDDIIRRLLVLFADHELTAPTYAVRAVANTGTTPYQAVTAGLVASKGYRISEGRSPAIRRIIDEILADPDPARPVIDRYRMGELIPGFDHKVYRGGDARTRALLPVMSERFHGEADFAKLERAIEVAHETLGVEPDLALLSHFIERQMNHQRPYGASIHVVGRLVGWIAHAYEQIEGGSTIRPRTAYTGALPTTLRQGSRLAQS